MYTPLTDNPAPSLARWFDRRLHAIDVVPTASLFGLTLIDPDVLDRVEGAAGGARSSFIADGDDVEEMLLVGRCDDAEAFDALALVRFVWLPAPTVPHSPVRSARHPDARSFTGRARARAVAVVGHEGSGCVVRFVDDPLGSTTVGGPAAAGLVVPLAALWSRSVCRS